MSALTPSQQRQKSINDAMNWIIVGSFACLGSAVAALAFQSINPLLYAFVPSELVLLVGLVKVKDKSLTGLISALSVSILFGAGAIGVHFGIQDIQLRNMLEISSFAILLSPFVQLAIKGRILLQAHEDLQKAINEENAFEILRLLEENPEIEDDLYYFGKSNETDLGKIIRIICANKPNDPNCQKLQRILRS